MARSKSPNNLAKANSPVVAGNRRRTEPKRLVTASNEFHLASREKILAAARTCFAKQGFAATSMLDIQKASGFSRGNLYHYFPTKEVMVQAITAENLGRFTAQIENLLASLSDSTLDLSQIITQLAGFAQAITEGPGKGMAFHVWSAAMVDSTIRATMVHHFEVIRNLLEQKIKILMSQGKIKESRNTKALSVTLFGIVIPGFTVQSVFMDEKSIGANEYAEALKIIFQSTQ